MQHSPHSKITGLESRLACNERRTLRTRVSFASRRDKQPGESITSGPVQRDGGSYYCAVTIVYEDGSAIQHFVWSDKHSEAVPIGVKVSLPWKYRHLWFRAQHIASEAMREFIADE